MISTEKPGSNLDPVIAIALREDTFCLNTNTRQRAEKLTGLVLLANIQRVVLRKVIRQSPNSVHAMASTVKDWRHLRSFVIRRARSKAKELTGRS